MDYYDADYVFVDEAAQATEPETAIAASLMSSGKQLILAGDPMQLGPICGSKVAEKYNLGMKYRYISTYTVLFIAS